MNSDYYVVNDLEKFTDSTRKIVFSFFGKEENTEHEDSEFVELMIDMSEKDQTEMDEVLSLAECVNIVKSLVKKQRNKVTQQHRYIINDAILAEVVDALNARLVSNLLSSLVQKGLVDTAYDAEVNDFVFWVKDQDNK